MSRNEYGDVIQNLYILHNNPFLFAEPMVRFYEALGALENNVVLAYLVLPMILHEPSRKLLQRDHSKTSLRTFLEAPERLHGLQRRIRAKRVLTNTTLQYLVSVGRLQVEQAQVVHVDPSKFERQLSAAAVCRAAKALGRIFQPYDVPTVYRMLGVMSL
ncbi:three component ABC system middle component [Cupriavidus malaysiensis]|uniref:Uncharacterized protein n=1 Tax=Cupriavidus malaysiensis TaxID=367825 RepID=A0ABM6F4Q6_9BURK|nr:three component ABC system middle component [Cupriavidus malaysiensis]AOZ06466.1 hypothetical protein BKK80_12025 [Cupriavidus malaysiensis]